MSDVTCAQIGIFDSGVGGLTLMRYLMEVLPQERILYFADTARFPYGNKNPDLVRTYTLKSAHFLCEHRIKLLVLACNTASVFAKEELQKKLSIPVVEVLTPTVKEALRVTRFGKIGILATQATIDSGMYQSLLLKADQKVESFPMACPQFVPIVEKGNPCENTSRKWVSKYLQPLKDASVDTVILGCTHFPILKNLIKDFLGKQVVLVDSSRCGAWEAQKVLKDKNLKTSSKKPMPHHYFVSDKPHIFHRNAQGVLGSSILDVQCAEI